jgi:hypothetical protein
MDPSGSRIRKTIPEDEEEEEATTQPHSPPKRRMATWKACRRKNIIMDVSREKLNVLDDAKVMETSSTNFHVVLKVFSVCC